MQELFEASILSASIDGEAKMNLLMASLVGQGLTVGLAELGSKSEVFRGGKRWAELKTGETRLLLWPRLATAAQHLTNELRVLPSATRCDMHIPIAIPPQLNEVACRGT